jgi:hypothetical protein
MLCLGQMLLYQWNKQENRMNPKLDPQQVGEQLGLEGVGSMVQKIEAYCTHEVRRIELVNESRIVALRAEAALLLEEERFLASQLRHAPPTLGRSQAARRVYAWAVVAFLVFAGFIFSVVAFDPFRLGWKSHLYCLGIAVVNPFLIHTVLERWNSGKLLKSLALGACVAAIVSLVLLAVIRGDILAQELSVVKAVVLLDDESTAPPQNDFYGATLPLLRIVMALLAIALELGSGLALEEAWRLGDNSGANWEPLRERLSTVRQRMLALAEEVTALRNEPAIFSESFWRNFYRSMVTHATRSAITKLLFMAVLVCTVPLSLRAAAEEKTIVVALDLTQSVQSAGPDEKSDFQKNVEAVPKLLGKVPPSTHVIVLGITDKSFAHPYILLSATVTDDAGHFGERIAVAQGDLVRLWKRRSARLKPEFRYTDIFGALLVAEQIFAGSPNRERHVLIILSDMRHHTPDLDLESGGIAPHFSALKTQNGFSCVALPDVEVFVAGVGADGKSIAYWESLRELWSEYFKSAGARLRAYSALRELSAIPQETVAH